MSELTPLDAIVTNLKAGDPKNLEEAVTSLQLIRNAANQAGKHILAKSIQQSIVAVMRSVKSLVDEAAKKQEAELEALEIETIEEIKTTVNGKDNNNQDNKASNITRNMSQSSRVLAP